MKARATPFDAVVCIPTFRRPEHLVQTLASLARQRTGRRFAVVVVDNDAAAQAGRMAAEEVFAKGPLQGQCAVEQRQGNCSAINRAFTTALAAYPECRYFLMIDDDELAQPDWLERMVATALRTGAGIVGGPVMPRFEPGSRSGLDRHPAFAPAYDKSGPVPVIYGSGNCLITRRTFALMGAPPFDTGYNFLGGGDTDFFVRARRAGVTFYWESDAVITETVPLARTRTGWLAARGLRIGAVNYRIERKHVSGSLGLVALAGKSFAVLGLSFGRSILDLARTREPTIALHPILVAVGRCLAALGVEPQPYRASTPRLRTRGR
ncbi:glycosyltransferase [Methylobacterium sp. 77]|uniref:glycosyltransferase family 2 protein n=1 Tax=Methylobacterium sp. 77 TaxID=1101192 RepID=UPI0003736FFE|nr:glycosyltransferase [Methylobacterium sp. 77]